MGWPRRWDRAAPSNTSPRAGVQNRSNGPESFKKAKAFQDWSGARFVFDERWVELPQAGLRVGYFLVPKAGSPAMGEPAFDDAFFVVDTRTARPVAEPVARTKSLKGCPESGEVPRLSRAGSWLFPGNGVACGSSTASPVR
jgi:hypothetical protein